jgi:hypothetical protein
MPLRDSVSRHLQASCHTLDAASTIEADDMSQSYLHWCTRIVLKTLRSSWPSIITVIAQGDRYSKNVATLGFRK